MNEGYVALASTGTFVFSAGTDGSQIELDSLVITADVIGAYVTFTDGVGSNLRRIWLNAGINNLHHALLFTPGKDVTLTAGGGNVTVFFRVNLKGK